MDNLVLNNRLPSKICLRINFECIQTAITFLNDVCGGLSLENLISSTFNTSHDICYRNVFLSRVKGIVRRNLIGTKRQILK